ncbi:MAG: PorT family protein [Microscillaceae bacterium]|nr:PorT family protein [Microscillaceae bacterium]MDW8460841.1 porin family protein [Cytophagales bacterium]
MNIRKSFLYLLLCRLISLPLQTLVAQTDSLRFEQEFEQQFALQKRLTIGLQVSYLLSNLYGKDKNFIFAEKATRWQSGFQLGSFLNTRINDNFRLKHELFITQRGANVSLLDNSSSETYTSQFRTYYLDLCPINPTFYYKGLEVYLGFYISGLMYADIQRINEQGKLQRDNSIFGTPDNREGENQNKYLQKFDFGLNTGINYQFSPKISLGLRYARGFTDLFQYANSFTNDDTKTDNINISNHFVVLSIGYNLSKNSQK